MKSHDALYEWTRKWISRRRNFFKCHQRLHHVIVWATFIGWLHSALLCLCFYWLATQLPTCFFMRQFIPRLDLSSSPLANWFFWAVLNCCCCHSVVCCKMKISQFFTNRWNVRKRLTHKNSQINNLYFFALLQSHCSLN